MSHELGERVYKNLTFLKKLARIRSESKRYDLLKEADREQLLLLVEICHNILKGNFLLTRKQKLRIVPFVPFIRALGNSRSERKTRKIVQKGAGFVSFAAILAPIIFEAIKNLTSGKTGNGQ